MSSRIDEAKTSLHSPSQARHSVQTGASTFMEASGADPLPLGRAPYTSQSLHIDCLPSFTFLLFIVIKLIHEQDLVVKDNNR